MEVVSSVTFIGRAFPGPHQEVVCPRDGGHWSLGQVLGEQVVTAFLTLWY